ncbi:MAG: Wzt carbohydrate-binding domain-containing protein, partial [Acidimicrobiales bacterium]
AKRFDEIVDFAELEPFIDNQVKHYSSGMYVRLGFAVAVNMDPDILLVDEVLAVGDENFQRKCLDRVRQFQREGRTIVFVTHGPDLVRQTCDRAAVLDQGKMVTLGPPGEAVRSFREHLLERSRQYEAGHKPVPDVSDPAAADEPRVASPDPVAEAAATAQMAKANLAVRITDVTIQHPGAGERAYLLPGQPLSVAIAYEAAARVDDVVFGLAVYDVEGRLVFGSNTDFLGVEVGPVEGTGEVCFETDAVPLLDGTYMLTIGVHSHDEGTVYDWRDQQHQFEVMNPGRTVGQVHMGLRVRATRGADVPH